MMKIVISLAVVVIGFVLVLVSFLAIEAGDRAREISCLAGAIDRLENRQQELFLASSNSWVEIPEARATRTLASVVPDCGSSKLERWGLRSRRRKAGTDQWGNAIRLFARKTTEGRVYLTLWSSGPDGEFSTDDDIAIPSLPGEIGR